jgi:hypothetical protein
MKISAWRPAAFNKPCRTHQPTTKGNNIATHLILLCNLNPIIQILSGRGIVGNSGEMSVELEKGDGERLHNVMFQMCMTLREFIERIARNVLHDVESERRKIGT